MAISAISPIVTPPVFVQPPAQLPAPRVEQTFDTALANTLNRLAAAPSTLQSATARAQAIDSLEQTLFTQSLNSLQSDSTGSPGGPLDGLLAGSLGITDSHNAFGLTLDTGSPQSLVFTARLISLFNTVDLLGGDSGLGPQPGSLLDTLA